MRRCSPPRSGTYPPYLAILQERAIASGDLLSARGAFDLNLNADSRNYPLGYYDRGVHDVFLEQPLRWNGAKVFAGYRLAQGQFPTYYNYLNTRGGGAFVSGFDLPLLRNREIDARRAKEVQAEIERRKVEPTILKQRIDLFKNVSKLYWNWVAAGQTLAISRDLVRVAEARERGPRTAAPRRVTPRHRPGRLPPHPPLASAAIVRGRTTLPASGDRGVALLPE